MKKVFLVSLAIVLVSGMILSGCAEPDSSPAPAPTPAPASAPPTIPEPAPETPSAEEEAMPTIDEVITNAVVALEELTTWRCEQSMHMDMEDSGTEDGHIIISMSGKGTIDLPDREMESDITTSAVTLGKETKTQQIIYFIEDMVYMRTDIPDMEVQWVKQTLSGDEVDLVWEILVRGLSAAADMLEAGHYEQLSMGEADGVPCYLLEGSLDTQEFSKLFQEITGSTQVLPFDVSEMFQDCKVSFWVAKDTYNLIQEKMTATISMEVEDVKIEGDWDVTSRYYDHGMEISIELPPEAAEAIEMPK